MTDPLCIPHQKTHLFGNHYAQYHLRETDVTRQMSKAFLIRILTYDSPPLWSALAMWVVWWSFPAKNVFEICRNIGRMNRRDVKHDRGGGCVLVSSTISGFR